MKQGTNFLPVAQVIPAQGDSAALQLMILIDDTLNPSVGNNLTDLKDFISAQPASTLIGVGYMANATANIVQTSPRTMISPSTEHSPLSGETRRLWIPLPIVRMISQDIRAG